MANHIGYSIYLSPTIPATNTDAGFEALTDFELVDGAQQAPRFGVSHAMIEIPDLLKGFTRVVKGAATGVETQMMFHREDGSSGHALAEEIGNDAGGLASVKIVVKGSGVNGAPVAGDVVLYAQGVAHSYLPNEINVTTHDGFSLSFRQNAVAVTGVEPT
jgi:hypothetical protein